MRSSYIWRLFERVPKTGQVFKVELFSGILSRKTKK
ncbi:hypothetical protein STSP2_01990 [Anaerohalosphaera lusitana]|uniref:Uncharacterized protein n=1 Tax=Anaerohalosphaera lusitana TaxID=1936003 RepID=A0A1U9NM53_9BACT|nr:hypothetical protein STSP2_01990 [Anaerohalosphaera lusitana]